MPDVGWFHLVTAALGGGLIVKFLDIIYQEFRRIFEQARSAKHFVDEHLDPLLKAADELVGKLRSLAEDDFKSLRNLRKGLEKIDNHDFGSLLFLLGRFWAQIEVIRTEGLSVSIVRDKRGKRLQAFMDCIESRRVRIVDRITQRAVGELMLIRRDGALETITFIEFVRLIETNSEAQRWIRSTARVLSRTGHTEVAPVV